MPWSRVSLATLTTCLHIQLVDIPLATIPRGMSVLVRSIEHCSHVRSIPSGTGVLGSHRSLSEILAAHHIATSAISVHS